MLDIGPPDRGLYEPCAECKGAGKVTAAQAYPNDPGAAAVLDKVEPKPLVVCPCCHGTRQAT